MFEHVILLPGENLSWFRVFGANDPNRDTYSNDYKYADGRVETFHSQESPFPYIGNDNDGNYHRNMVQYINRDPMTQEAKMDQFVQVASAFSAPKDIMAYFPKTAFPFLNYLADRYMRLDRYFSSWIGCTIPNIAKMMFVRPHRMDFNQLDTDPLLKDDSQATSLFHLMNENGVDWKVYCGDWANMLHFDSQWHVENLAQYVSHQQLYDDLDQGTLPKFSYVDTAFRFSTSDRRLGYLTYYDDLFRNVYTKLRNSEYWGKTLFIINFDEAGGGWFDPIAPPPGLGIRVPAVLIHPQFENAVPDVGTVLHHESVTKFILRNFQLVPEQYVQDNYGDVTSIDEVNPVAKTTPSPDNEPEPPQNYHLDGESLKYKLLFPLLVATRAVCSQFARVARDISFWRR